jgi:tetratricopeptide (TPR) repeat protein
MKKQRICLLAAAALALAATTPVTLAAAWTQRDTDACVNRTNSFSKDEQISGCTESIRSGRWSGKNLAWAYANRCIAYKDKEMYERAMVDCNRAIELDPRDDHAFNTRGAIYHLTKKYDAAIKEYSTAIRLNSTFLDPVHNRGMSYAAKGDYDTAIADYNAALKLNPRDALALYERGVAKEKQGNKEDGGADIEAAKQIDPHIAD